MENLLPGISAMANIHPLLVHFPIAFLSVFFIVEILGAVFKSERFHKAASWFLFCGALGAAAAVVAGFRAAATVPHVEEAVHDIMENHEHLMVAVLTMTLILFFWRLFGRRTLAGKARLAYLFIAFVMVVTMAFGADYGGLLVYKYGVGVEAVKVEGVHEHNMPDKGGALPGETAGEAGGSRDHSSDAHTHPPGEGH